MKTQLISNALNRLMGAAKKRRVGMTLVEILIVLVIIASIMGFAAYSFFGATKGAKISEASSEILHLKSMVEAYASLRNGNLPNELADLAVDDGGGKITDNVPDDPWGNPYEYSRNNDGSFEIYSRGPDGQQSTADDVYGGQIAGDNNR